MNRKETGKNESKEQTKRSPIDYEDEYRRCGRKRAAQTLDYIQRLAAYFEDLYGKPFGFYLCKICAEYHLYSIK